jgi:hypothetical protein|tara:strand:+ start:1810 stop:2241 length:432 start_codon:yes stop_codon:yes gene_type:complete
MGSKKIIALLERYLEGNTTLEEEKVLSAYFKSTQSIPENWESYRMFFGYFDHAKTFQFPIYSNRKRINIKPWMAAAALIAVVVSIQLNTLYRQNTVVSNQEQVEYTFQQFKTNMKIISNHLNKGTQKLAYLDYWNTATLKFIK